MKSSRLAIGALVGCRVIYERELGNPSTNDIARIGKETVNDEGGLNRWEFLSKYNRMNPDSEDKQQVDIKYADEVPVVEMKREEPSPFALAVKDMIGEMALQQLHRNPLSLAEVDGTLSALKKNPHRVKSAFPPQCRDLFAPEEISYIFGGVRDCLLDADFMSDVDRDIAKQEVRRNRGKNAYIEDYHQSPDFFQVPLADEWDSLIGKYRCTICCDVLAAPHSIACEHEFCYECIADYQQSCIKTDTDCECPLCKKPLTGMRYSMILDQTIAQEAEQCPDSERKEEWKRRRDVYMQLRSLHNQKSNKEKEEEANSNADPRWSQYFAATVGVAVLVILVIMRRRV